MVDDGREVKRRSDEDNFDENFEPVLAKVLRLNGKEIKTNSLYFIGNENIVTGNPSYLKFFIKDKLKHKV